MPRPLVHTALFHLPFHFSHMLAHANGNFHAIGAQHGGTLLIRGYSKLIWLRMSLQALTIRQKLVAVSIAILLPAGVSAATFMLPRSVDFAYAGNTCFTQPTILPNLVSTTHSASYRLERTNHIYVGSYPLLSRTNCVTAHEAPAANTEQRITSSMLGLRSTTYVNTPELPLARTQTDLTEPVGVHGGITLLLDKPDEVFSYLVAIEQQEQPCDKAETLEINCSLSALELEQGETYSFSILRNFKDSAEVILDDNITLKDPVVFTQSSIRAEQTVYSSPEALSLQTNKPLKRVGDISLKTGSESLGVSHEISDKGLVIRFKDRLPRSENVTLSVLEAEADDGAFLDEPFTLSFTTSGGPKVSGVNIGSYNVSPTGSVIISFDTEVSAKNVSNYVKLSDSSGTISSSVSVSGRNVTMRPSEGFARCQSFTVSVVDGIQNSHGISGDSSWSLNSRTTCRQIFSIGSSVEGRALTAYRFGSGSERVLFVGGMHGNERSSYQTLIAFADELERRYSEIPANKTIVIVPDVNPDGYARGSRTNARGVDLNRNFPSNDWQEGVYMPGGVYSEDGGGSEPLSEPESAQLASYVTSFGPQLVLTYHAVARTVIDNGAGNAASIANRYAVESGYSHYSHSHEDGIFNYETTGEFETWLADKKSIPTLLVELSTMSSNELYSQRSAMWAMVRL